MKKRNFFCNSVIALSAILGLTLSAQVKLVNGPIPLDGGYSEGVWKDVPEQTPFILLKRMGKTQPDAQTAFKVAADADNLYLNIRCSEKLMGKLKKTENPAGLWSSDLVEIFLSPTGQPDEYYQFAATAGNLRYNMFYGESGVIRPDPYSPFWESKVFYGKDYWQVQVRIPFSAFYMTRNSRWSDKWLLNIARTRMTVSEFSTWSPLRIGFHQPQDFRKFTGFPKRNPAQDVLIAKAEPIIRTFIDGVYAGPLKLTVEANRAAAGKYELSVQEPDGKSSVHEITLKGGLHKVVVPKVEYLKKALGKTDLTLTLKSKKTGSVFGRSYPVDIVYQPIGITLTSPGYKRNFYPGQDYSMIRGELKLNLSEEQRKNAEVKLSISGDGLEEKTQSFKADGGTVTFSFESSALTEGGKALLTAKLLENGRETASATCTVTRLKKNKGSMVWIENNALIKNGKPWYPRFIYAQGYLGGTAFAERFNADDLAATPVRTATLEPFRLIRGLESKEARKDVKPCPELFEKVRAIVEKHREDPDFCLYYISDEPECRHVSPVYLKHIYDFVSELDPYHPVFTCTREAGKYLDCADILSCHAYLAPVVSEGKRFLAVPVHRVRNYLQEVTKSLRPDKVVGFTGQFFSYKFNYVLADYPTWEELESMSWSAIAQGSRFQYPYAYHELGDRPQLYEGYRYFNQSIRALEKQLLSNKKYPVKTVDPENMIDTLLVEGDGVTLLIVVNLKNGPLETEISSEHLKQFKSLLEFRGDGSRELDNGTLKLTLKPYECAVLTSKKMDEGLKTRAQVVKDIAEAEKARSSRGSLLFEKGATFEVDSSNPSRAVSSLFQRNKLFDGTLDILGWQSALRGKDHWYELNFRKNPPKFSKIRIYGCNMGDPAVKIWKFGEWKNLSPKKTEKGKYSVLLDFGEELKSVKVRINFLNRTDKKQVELYEIELLK